MTPTHPRGPRRAASAALRAATVLPAILALAAAAPASAKTVTLAARVTIDQVAPEDAKMYRVGGFDLLRIAYDDTKVNPKTHTVPLSMLEHFIGGHWMTMEYADASRYDVDTGRLDFIMAAVHGKPVVAVFESMDGKMAMLSHPDMHVLITGNYKVDRRPLTAAQIAAPPVGANDPNLMPKLSGPKP